VSSDHERLSSKRRKRRWIPGGIIALAVVLTLTLAVVVVQPLPAFTVLVRIFPGIVWRIETSQPVLALTR
jgi:hypothetical protein